MLLEYFPLVLLWLSTSLINVKQKSFYCTCFLHIKTQKPTSEVGLLTASDAEAWHERVGVGTA